MLNIVTNFKVIHHTLTYGKKILLMIIFIQIMYSPTSYQSLHNGSNNTVLGSCYSAHQSVSRLRKTILIWSALFIENARLELVCRGALISRLNVSL